MRRQRRQPHGGHRCDQRYGLPCPEQMLRSRPPCHWSRWVRWMRRAVSCSRQPTGVLPLPRGAPRRSPSGSRVGVGDTRASLSALLAHPASGGREVACPTSIREHDSERLAHRPSAAPIDDGTPPPARFGASGGPPGGAIPSIPQSRQVLDEITPGPPVRRCARPASLPRGWAADPAGAVLQGDAIPRRVLHTISIALSSLSSL